MALVKQTTENIKRDLFIGAKIYILCSTLKLL